MGTHPIFESDFDCLTERLREDRVENDGRIDPHSGQKKSYR